MLPKSTEKTRIQQVHIEDKSSNAKLFKLYVLQNHGEFVVSFTLRRPKPIAALAQAKWVCAVSSRLSLIF